jgi:hypothetical protein
MSTKLQEVLLDDLVEQCGFRSVAHMDRRPGHATGIRAGRWQQYDPVPAMWPDGDGLPNAGGGVFGSIDNDFGRSAGPVNALGGDVYSRQGVYLS